jgi:branched-chain amino acid aminotransferase
VKYWVAGALVPAEQARVTVVDHGFTVGDGVFETMRTVNDPDVGVVPFALDRHLVRLSRSAQGMGLPAVDTEEVREALLAVCAANPELADGGRLRVTLTSGAGPLGSDRSAGASSLVVAASAATSWPPATTLALSPWPRNERGPLTGIKSTSYAENVMALARAKAAGAGEALLANLAGHVCEGTGSNVFVVLGSAITTPPLSTGCLAGITRALVIEWCADAGLEVEQRTLTVEELTGASEIFITSSTRDVHPVDAVLDDQGQRIWASVSTTRTQLAAEIFTTRSTPQWNRG